MRHVINCPQIKFPCDLIDEKVFQKNCCYGSCRDCLTFSHTSPECILQCPTLFDDMRLYTWKEYTDHKLDNNNSIRELREVQAYGAEFRIKFVEKLAKYKQHYFKYKWLNLCRKADIAGLRDCDLYIQTDYSAQPVLDSQDKLNSQGHGVCVLSCWVVLHSPEKIKYRNEFGMTCEMVHYECDHIRVVSPSKGKGKDQDWYLHCTIFDFLIDRYKCVKPNLCKVIVWTDGAPTQYKCRQNFFYVAQSYRNHDVQIVHRFGATAQFKGVHDKVGQVAKYAVG